MALLARADREILDHPTMTTMQEMASAMWRPWFVFGLLIMVVSLIFGAIASNFAADYFEFPKAVRDGTNASLIDKRVFIETTKTWVPAFQFLGMGFLFGAITQLLAWILGNFRLWGARVQQAADRKMYSLKPPWTARVFPMLMFGGLLLLLANLALSATLAFIAHGLYANPIAEIDAATSGSLLDNLQTLQTYQAWLEPFRFVGIAMMLLGISLALYTIVRALRFQTERVEEMALGAD